MQKQSYQNLAKQSQQAFKKQFDPNSTTYHGGSDIVVPLHGERVPQSMKSMYPQGYDPSKTVQNIDYGENYRKVQVDRGVYLNIKKSLASLCQTVQSIFRMQTNMKQKINTLNEKQLKTQEDGITKQKSNLNQINTTLNGYVNELQKMGDDGKMIAVQLKQVIDEKSLTGFNFKVKKISTQVFSNAQKCLQKLKDIKKQYANKNNYAEKLGDS